MAAVSSTLGLSGKYTSSLSVERLHLDRLIECFRVLESIKAGKRLPEAQFSNMSIAPKGQKSVYGMFKKTEIATSDENETPVLAS